MIEAPPGAGKTTRVPPALLDQGTRRSARAGAAKISRAPGCPARRQRTRRARRRNRRLSGAFRGRQRSAHALAVSDRRRADAAAVVRSHSGRRRHGDPGRIPRAASRYRSGARAAPAAAKQETRPSVDRHVGDARCRPGCEVPRRLPGSALGRQAVRARDRVHAALARDAGGAGSRGARASHEERRHGRRARVSPRRRRNPPGRASSRALGIAVGPAGFAAARRSFARRAGPRGVARRPSQSHPVDECRGEFSDHRRSHGGHRQRSRAGRRRFALDRTAFGRGAPHQPGVGHAARRARGTHCSRPRDPPVLGRGLSSPTRGGHSGDSAARAFSAGPATPRDEHRRA